MPEWIGIEEAINRLHCRQGQPDVYIIGQYRNGEPARVGHMSEVNAS